MMETDDSEDMDDFFAEVERLHRMRGIKGFITRFRAGRWRYYVRLPIEWPKDRYYDFVAFLQRGRRGWADRDVWEMDTYLAAVIAPMLRHMAETTYGVPGSFGLEVHAVDVEGESDEMKAWKAYLLELACAFDDYLSLCESDGKYVLETYDPVLEKMRHLFDHYPSLWT